LQELADAFTEYSVQITEEELGNILYAADLNKDGVLDFQEWKTAMLINKEELSQEKIN